MQDLRIKAEELKAKTETSLCAQSFVHWFTLCQERLRLQPIEFAIETSIRRKWLLKVTYAALARYKAIREGKKKMYASICHYHKQMLVERTFRSLVDYSALKCTLRDM